MTKITGESCIFVQGKPAKLLFHPAGSVRLNNPTTGQTFEENTDFRFDSASGTLIRTADSRIPCLTDADLYPTENVVYFPAPNANALTGGPNGQNLRFDGRLFFAKHQVVAEYETDHADWPADCFRKSPFAPVCTDFKRMVSLGDSITEGYNATFMMKEAPFQKPYAGLVADAIGAELTNLGKNGASVDYLKDTVGEAIKLMPDLITIAFGMNDLKRYTPDQYIERIAAGVQTLRQALPDAVIVCVSPMTGNPEWSLTPVENTKGFANALAKWTQENKVIFADVCRVWAFAIERKGFFSMTGNGVNHPNDFGHSIYAKTILSVLGIKS